MKITTPRLTAAVILAATVFGLASPAGAASASSSDAGSAPGGSASSAPTTAPAEVPGDVAPESRSGASSYGTFAFSGFSDSTGSVYNAEPFAGPGKTPIVGQFSSTPAKDVLWYTPGVGGDVLKTNQGAVSFFTEPLNVSVNGTYTPYVGTFATADGYDDILWYSANGPSQLWDFNGNTGPTKSSLGAVTGPGQILIGDFSLDGIDDVIRYRPGTASDSWWDFQTMGHVSRAFNINGTYTPIVGESFASDASDDILWYAPGTGVDWLWDFSGGGAHEEWKLGINGTYTPVVGRFTKDGHDDIIWYAPGSTGDSMWDFDGVGYVTKALSVNGYYAPYVCSCLGSSLDDVIWFKEGLAADSAWQSLDTMDFTYSAKAADVPGSSIKAAGRLGTVNELMIVRF